jgi:hypothetical protein
VDLYSDKKVGISAPCKWDGKCSSAEISMISKVYPARFKISWRLGDLDASKIFGVAISLLQRYSIFVP